MTDDTFSKSHKNLENGLGDNISIQLNRGAIFGILLDVGC